MIEEREKEKEKRDKMITTNKRMHPYNKDKTTSIFITGRSTQTFKEVETIEYMFMYKCFSLQKTVHFICRFIFALGPH